MNELDLGTVKLPIESATKTFAILAKRGAGKSYTAAVMAEEFFKVGVPFVIFDPIDVWWGLRFNKTGKGKGLPIVVFGLEHADIPLTRDMGKQIAKAVVRENVSCVISTFGMPKVAQRQLIADFAEEILNINNTPRHIFIEEAHEFVPQRVFGALGRTFSAVEALVVMGRNRGIGVTLINQRAATINKDVLTQLDTLLAFRNVAPQDRKALGEWVEAHSAEGDFEEFWKSLPSLPTGEGWIWSPEFLNKFERIKIRERETFHPDREKLGETFVMPKLEQADIQEFIRNFTSDIQIEEIEATENPVPTLAIHKRATHFETEEEKTLKQQILDLSEEHRKELEAKDLIIEGLETRLDKIRTIAGNGEESISSINPVAPKSLDKVNMWVGKLRTGPAKIFMFLAEKYPMKFSRSQLALANGIRINTLTRNGDYLPTLKRNSLIREEAGFITINPDLLS
jgi:hypothetical protein